MLSTTFKLAVVVAAVAAAGVGAGWKATLTPVGESGVSGEATVENERKEAMGDSARQDDGKLVASIRVKGAKDGELLPWHVHSGACGTADAPVVGSPNDYSPITITASGEGRATASPSAPLTASGLYHVNVHKSATDAAVISCGALKATGTPADR